MYEATQNWAMIKDYKPKRDIVHVLEDAVMSGAYGEAVMSFAMGVALGVLFLVAIW